MTFKEFFQQKWVKIVAWILVAIGIIALIIGGATSGIISQGVELVIAIVTAVAALVAFIIGQLANKK